MKERWTRAGEANFVGKESPILDMPLPFASSGRLCAAGNRLANGCVSHVRKWIPPFTFPLVYTMEIRAEQTANLFLVLYSIN